MEKNVLDFEKYMDNTSVYVKEKIGEPENGKPGWYHSGERICFMLTSDNYLEIFFGHQSSVCTSEIDFPISEELKEFVWANISICTYCGEELPDGVTIQSNPCRQGDNIIFGKKFDNLCNCPIRFTNPDTKTLEKVKELVEAWKLCIDITHKKKLPLQRAKSNKAKNRRYYPQMA